MGSCASSVDSIPPKKLSKAASPCTDSYIVLQSQHQISTESGTQESSKDIDTSKIVNISHDVHGERYSTEKVQATNIDRSHEAKKLDLLGHSGSKEQRIVFKYYRDGIYNDVPMLASPKNSSILKRRQKSTNYSPRPSTADSIPKRFTNENLQATIKPLRPYVSKVHKFIR